MPGKKLSDEALTQRLDAMCDEDGLQPNRPLKVKLKAAADTLGVTFSALDQQFCDKNSAVALRPSGNWFTFKDAPFDRGHIGEVVAIYRLGKAVVCAERLATPPSHKRVRRSIIRPAQSTTHINADEALAALALLEKTPDAVNTVFVALTQILQENEIYRRNNAALDQANKSLAERLAEVTRERYALEGRIRQNGGRTHVQPTNLGQRLGAALKERKQV